MGSPPPEEVPEEQVRPPPAADRSHRVEMMQVEQALVEPRREVDHPRRAGHRSWSVDLGGQPLTAGRPEAGQARMAAAEGRAPVEP